MTACPWDRSIGRLRFPARPHERSPLPCMRGDQPFRHREKFASMEKSPPWLRWYVGAIALAAVLICSLLAKDCFPLGAFEPDTTAYLFEAKLLGQGRLSAEAPPDFGFSSSPHINIYAGRWFSKYPFGNSLLLVPGVLLGAPWIMPALFTGLTLLLYFAVMRELFDWRTGSVALFLAFISPTTLLIGATLLSQPASRLCMALFLYAMLRVLKQAPGTRRSLLACLAGLALGYGFNTRPLVAIVFGIVGAGFALCRIAHRTDRRRFVPAVLWGLTGVLAMLALYFAWNAALTGDPGLSTYHVLQQADRMGFGMRGEGYAPFIQDFRIDFTPAYAWERIWTHTLPAVLLNATGWGWYQPSMFYPADPHFQFPSLAPLLLLPLVLIVLALLHRSRGTPDCFCAFLLLTNFAAHFFQYADHTSWGATPLHASYYSEATLFGLIPLLARGILILHGALTRRFGRIGEAGLITIGVLLLANTIHSDSMFIGWFKNWDPYYQRLPELVAVAKLHHAVVFVPHSRDAPLGEYPFKPLDQAEVVYFRTGPLPAWGLRSSDWRAAYAAYFIGRNAYVYEAGELRKLEAVAPQP